MVLVENMKGEMTLEEFLRKAKENAPQGFQIKRYPWGVIARPDKCDFEVDSEYIYWKMKKSK